jgi:predicted ATPase/DNA-binding CsgD family transcriptional regulator
VEGSAADTAAGVHGFPVVLTSFVGRAGAVREVAGLLEEYRLVTVTGPGGVGKTRLAGEVARRVAGRFADGVWLAELAPVGHPEQVPTAVTVALGVREQAGVPAAEALMRVLGRQQLLVVLDNCEHVIGAAAQLSASLLQACDDIRILATSREPLRIAGEAACRLAPLPVPGPGDAGDDVAGAEAVTLFADRARAADAGFALTGQNRADVARLVGRLDGMPLAIELAAARAEALGVSQLLESLDGRVALLAGGDRLAAGRHRSLAATAEWSYLLLDEAERWVFRHVSVFPAPFTMEAAEAVAGQGAALAVLRLVECSLLVPPRPGPDGRSRYAMLETLRAYGAGLLAGAGEQDGAAAALAAWTVQVAELAAGGLQAFEGELTAARWLDAEGTTTAQVLAWAMDHDPAVALRLAVALAPWWFLRGRLTSQYALLRVVAGRAGPGSAGWCAAQFWLGMTARFSADLAGALGYFTAIRVAVEDQGPSRMLADALIGRSSVLRELGRLAEATEDARSALALAREVGYPAGEALALSELSESAMHADDLGSAGRLARQARQVTAGISGRIGRRCTIGLAGALIEAGDLAAAEGVCAAALARFRDAGHLENLTQLLIRMALVDAQAGRVDDAAAHLREAVQIAARTGFWFELLNALDVCGYLCAATGRRAETVTAWAAFAALSRHLGVTESPAMARQRQQPLRQAREGLGPDRTRAAEERGAAMSMDTAAEYALMLTAPRQPAGQAAGTLSAREWELVTLVARGRTDAQIAAQLYISIRTVRSHLDRIRDKTGCRRRADLTRLALAEGLV